MSKISGKIEDFSLVREERSRYVVGYGLTATGVNDMYEWYEVYFYKLRDGKPTLEAVKKAIHEDINKQTDEKILNGYEFTPDGEEEPIVVWLSNENQTNFSEAHRLQVVPVKFKLNEDEEKNAIYHTFTTFSELDRFYKGGMAYIQQCLQEGWQRKDSIDWEPYEELLKEESWQR
jgi:hypothetical protein